jgi:hypothetical protein
VLGDIFKRMTAPRFDTITTDDWKRSLRMARERRKGARERIAKAIRLSGVATKRQERTPSR